MLSLALFACVLCFLCLWWRYARAKSSSPHALPPAVPGEWPIIGHSHHLLMNLLELVKFLSEDCAKKGGVTYFSLGQELHYLIHDPQDALTAANLCTEKHYFYKIIGYWLGNGLLTSAGEMWKNHRKLLNPAFSLPVIHGFLDVFNRQSKKLAISLEPNVGKGPFDQIPYLKQNVLETLCVGTFGINAIDDVEFIQNYMGSLNESERLVVNKGLKFWLQNDLINRLFGQKKKEEELLKSMRALTNTVLQNKKSANEIESVGNKYKAFLDLLLDLSKYGALTDKEIREQMDTIIAAGFETTSNQLTYTLLLLGAHPEIQEKLYEELLEVLGPDRDVEKEDVNKLVYTNAVLMESLRTLPSVPFVLRTVDKDVKLKNYTMRAGSYCVIFPLASDFASSWGAHSDQFNPEKWLDGDFRNNKEFAAFGLGKRTCIGRTYTMISMKVTLAHFVRRYRVRADMSKLKMVYEILLKPVSGHEISIERRM